MLFNLSIENVALIEKADINFGEGFHVLTGETGAGKSILIGSLNILLGERIARDMIRSGKSYAFVEGLFYISEQATEALKKLDIYPEEDGSLIVSRKLTADGKNLCKAGGKTISVSTLRDIGRLLINIHGQHDNQALLDNSTHVSFLDAFSKETEASVYAEYDRVYTELKETERALEELTIDEAAKIRQADMLRFETEEIKCAALYVGEEEELKQQKTLAQNKESFARNCVRATDLLYENEEGACVYNLLTDIQNSLEQAAETDSVLAEPAEKIADMRYSIEDITAIVRERLQQVHDQAFPLNDIEERLDLIYRLKRKYGDSEAEILEYCARAEQDLAALENSDARKQELSEQKQKLTEQAQHLASVIHDTRVQFAKEAEKCIGAVLSDLQMEGAVFSVHMESCPLSKHGTDKVEFLLSANKGEPLKPLSKIVSGGELSRIMLAMKHVLSAGDVADTLIFDEIDSGISGRAAGKVGIKLREMADKKQVLCVTHLPQIAALSHLHYKISKQEESAKTVTRIRMLDAKEKQAEIALMIGGDSVSKTTLAQAAEMIENANR